MGQARENSGLPPCLLIFRAASPALLTAEDLFHCYTVRHQHKISSDFSSLDQFQPP